MKLPSHILIVLFFLVTSYFLLVTPTFAQNCPNPNDWRCVIGTINDPTGVPGNTGDEKLSSFLSTAVRLIFIGGAVVFVFMIVFGAFQWITSTGDKDKVDKARKTIVNAIIGLILLSLSFVIINVVATITGIGILRTPFSGGSAPQLSCTPTQIAACGPNAACIAKPGGFDCVIKQPIPPECRPGQPC